MIVGEGKTFSFMDKDLKDIGQNNFTNLSFMTGSSVRSNYFNADKEARKIISNITDSTFFKTRKGMLLRDFKDKLSGYKYADMNKSTITDYEFPYAYLYCFDQRLSSEGYEYIYGYRIPTKPEYNYNANLSAVIALNSSYKDFQPGSEEELGKCFDALIQKHGYKKDEEHQNWYVNDKTGMSVGLGYEDGSVNVKCVYIPRYRELEVKRVPRNETSKDNVQLDYVDAFGFDNLVDSDAVVVEANVDEE